LLSFSVVGSPFVNYKFFKIKNINLWQEEVPAAAPYPSFKPASSKPSPDTKYQAFKAQQQAAAAANPGFNGGGAPKPAARQPVPPVAAAPEQDEDDFYRPLHQTFFSADRSTQHDRHQQPSLPPGGDFNDSANDDDGFGPFSVRDFAAGPVAYAPVAAAAPGETLEEMLAKKNKVNPDRPGFSPPKLIERFSSPVVEPSISYNQPQV
jgi:hypothetical protein